MESGIILDTPERIMPKGGNLKRNSTGKTNTRASLLSSNSEEKIPPNYLKASTSSCHDVCKYGGRHIFGREGKQAISSMVSGGQKIPVEGQNQMNNVKKKQTIKIKASPAQGTKFSDKPKIIKPIALSPYKKITDSAKSKISSKPKTLPLKSSSPSNPRGSISGRRGSENSIAKKSGSSSTNERKVLTRPTASVLTKSSVNGFASLKPMKNMNTKAPVRVKNQNKVRKPEPKDEQVKEKTLYVINEPKLENKSMEPVSLDSINNKNPLSSPSASLPSPPLSSSPIMSSHEDGKHEGSKSAWSEETEKKERTELSIQEDYVLETTKPLLRSTHEEHEGSDSPLSKDTEKKKANEISTGRNNRRPRRSLAIHTEDKDSVPRMLKFKRGKVISPQYENNSPRRLKFRRRRVVGNDQNNKGGEVGRRDFGKRELGTVRDSYSTNPKMQTVELRHRDVQQKKDGQGLFNHVIEETANKLVKTRRSKVKALVSAFETVISLQE